MRGVLRCHAQDRSPSASSTPLAYSEQNPSALPLGLRSAVAVHLSSQRVAAGVAAGSADCEVHRRCAWRVPRPAPSLPPCCSQCTANRGGKPTEAIAVTAWESREDGAAMALSQSTERGACSAGLCHFFAASPSLSPDSTAVCTLVAPLPDQSRAVPALRKRVPRTKEKRSQVAATDGSNAHRCRHCERAAAGTARMLEYALLRASISRSYVDPCCACSDAG